jgi:divalent metal cation (Fe/Co/Zn/Cd) transporter
VVRVAAKAPDEDQSLWTRQVRNARRLLIALLLALSIFELVRGAIARLITGSPVVSVSSTALALLVFTLVVNIGVVWFETRAGRRLASDLLWPMLCTPAPTCLSPSGVLAGLFLARYGLEWADPTLALIVAILVGRAGYQILRRSIPTLVDERALDQATIQREAEGVTGVFRPMPSDRAMPRPPLCRAHHRG